MRLETKKIRKFIRNFQIQKNILNNKNKESKFLFEKTSYNKKILSKKIEQKRKRKIYKSQFEKSIFFESQNQFEFFLNLNFFSSHFKHY